MMTANSSIFWLSHVFTHWMDVLHVLPLAGGPLVDCFGPPQVSSSLTSLSSSPHQPTCVAAVMPAEIRAQAERERKERRFFF